MRYLILFLFWILTSVSLKAAAIPASRLALLQQLMIVQQVPQAIENTRQSFLKDMRKNVQFLYNTPLDNLIIKQDCVKKMNKGFAAYLEEAAKPLSKEHVIDIYNNIYKNFTDNELNELIMFYGSPTGKKELDINPGVPSEFLNRYVQLQQEQLKKNDYLLQENMPTDLSSCLSGFFKILGKIR